MNNFLSSNKQFSLKHSLHSCFSLLSFALSLSIAFCFSTTVHANLVSGTLSALDSASSPRTPPVFNNSERIGFRYSVTNTQSSAQDIIFSFTLTDPQGRIVFTHTGNAVSGTQVGESGGSIAGVVVAQFYTVPGTYNLKGEAKFADGSESVNATLAIQIFSPVLNLTYPPNSASNLTDQPLVFRWIGTGATKYRFTLSDNPALFNPILTTEIFESQFSYPTNPGDSRQRLAAGTNYYWNVKGLDAVSVVTSEAPFPYSFTISGGASQAQSKDLAITSIDPSPFSPAGQVNVTIKVVNNGGRPESAVNVSVFVQGTSQGKKMIDSINPGETKSVDISVVPPTKQTGSGYLVSATLEGFFDDNLMNNSMTRQLPWPAADASTAKAKIFGSVWTESSPGSGVKKFLEGADISYDGPIKGTVKSNAGGEYKIEDLPLGDYNLQAKFSGYPDGTTVIVAVSEAKVYTNRDLQIPASTTAKAKTDEKKTGTSTIDVSKAQDTVLKAIPAEAAKVLKGYQLQSVTSDGLDDKAIGAILSGIADGSVKVLSVTVE